MEYKRYFFRNNQQVPIEDLRVGDIFTMWDDPGEFVGTFVVTKPVEMTEYGVLGVEARGVYTCTLET
jgi:hypothetical protein